MRILVLPLLLGATACAGSLNPGGSLSQQAERLHSMTPQEFADATLVKNDELEAVISITTEPAFKPQHGLLGIVHDDNFLRAFIDKQTGIVSYQLYQVATYAGSGWRHYHSINYQTPQGLQTGGLTRIGSDVDCSLAQYQGCSYFEHVAFEMPEQLIQAIAAQYDPAGDQAWRFRLKSNLADGDWDDGIVPAEAAGLLIRADQERERLGFSS